MKLIYALFVSCLFLIKPLHAQQSEVLDYCNCIDKADQITPVTNGKFERTCKGKVIETGQFADNAKDGEWVTYNQKGIVIRRINYSKGSLNGKSQVFFNDGAPKLSASFSEGKKTDKWTYFTKNGKVLIEGEYANGKPIKIWTINNEKGNTPIIRYDYDNRKYITQGQLSLHNNNAIIKNDNTGEFYILIKPVTSPKAQASAQAKTSPLGGFALSHDLFIDLVEVPQNYWDTYIQYEYSANFNINEDNECDFKLTFNNDNAIDSEAKYPFLINTNRDAKIKKIDHSPFSRRMLDDKIKEAISFLPPWVSKGSSNINVDISYVVNRIVDFSKPIERKYN
jgi:hypothetical protein